MALYWPPLATFLIMIIYYYSNINNYLSTISVRENASLLRLNFFDRISSCCLYANKNSFAILLTQAKVCLILSHIYHKLLQVDNNRIK